MRRSGKARRGLGAARQTGRPPEAVGSGLQPDRSDAVLALVVGDLARIWRKQRRKRGPSSRNGGVLQTTSRGEQMETVELSRQQSACMAELPEDYRVVGVERRTPLVRKPSGQIIRIQQNGRMTAATAAARRRVAAVARQRIANYEGDA